MRHEMCLCASIPRLETITKVILLMHRREALKPTNTGRLATLALVNSETKLRGARDDSCRDYDFSSGGYQPLLLFPSDKAEILSASFLDSFRQPIALVVPDGSWRQASKVGTRIPALASVPHVKLPLGPPSAYHLRRETKAEGLATLEGIARALGIIESKDVQSALEGLLALMVQRTLKVRGTARQELI